MLRKGKNRKNCNRSRRPCDSITSHVVFRGSRAADVESNERQGALGCTKTAKRNANRNELEKLYNKQHGAAGDLIWEIGLKVDRKIGENWRICWFSICDPNKGNHDAGRKEGVNRFVYLYLELFKPMSYDGYLFQMFDDALFREHRFLPFRKKWKGFHFASSTQHKQQVRLAHRHRQSASQPASNSDRKLVWLKHFRKVEDK